MDLDLERSATESRAGLTGSLFVTAGFVGLVGIDVASHAGVWAVLSVVGFLRRAGNRHKRRFETPEDAHARPLDLG